MSDVTIRTAVSDDLPAIVEIYNHYVINTAITFDIESYTVEQRRPWFEQFAPSGPHRLFVAESDGAILGYAGSHQFRVKAAYDTTVETTIYCAPGNERRGIGGALYATLFGAIVSNDIHMVIGGITMPNDASIALHKRFGFVHAGLMHDVGYKFGRYWDVLWMERPFGATS